jgi:hypothetical protein
VLFDGAVVQPSCYAFFRKINVDVKPSVLVKQVNKAAKLKLPPLTKWHLIANKIDDDSTVVGDDESLKIILKSYATVCAEESMFPWLRSAVGGLQRSSLEETYRDHCKVNGEHDLDPPQLIPNVDGTQSWKKPGTGFKAMSTDAIHVMEIFFTSCNQRHCAPIRLNWQYALFREMKILNVTDDQLRKRCMLFCLRLSGASTDKSCMESTARLYHKGYLDLNEMAKADPDVIADLIRDCG